MRLIQFEVAGGARRVGLVDGGLVREVRDATSTRELALAAIAAGQSLAGRIETLGLGEAHDYALLLAERRVLAPLDHPDPAHCLVSGTGLTHLGSASARDKMHQQNLGGDAALTDTMRVFRWGLEGGKPAAGQAGAQPEWFYKGDGGIVVRPGADLPLPPFAEDAGEEPELAGLYVIGDDGRPYRLGFALGNEFSDHVMERRNYLYLAHSKLRFCSFGPELRLGELPRHLSGFSRIRRDGAVLWEQEFLSGEDNMCHSLENLEYHHFKYAQFLRPGDVHVHFFGTATLSFADGVKTQPGDRFEIGIAEFGEPLSNGIAPTAPELRAGSVDRL
ncbi:AraD1 family protein [Azotobacter chroococcum]|nr:AraD1 family protein [Azotobacter chroococcum]